MTYTNAFKVLCVFRNSSERDVKPSTSKHTHFSESQVQLNLIKSKFRNFKKSTKIFARKQKEKPQLSRTLSQIVAEVCLPSPCFNYARWEREREAKLNSPVQPHKNQNRSKVLNFVSEANSKTKQQMRRVPISFKRATDCLTKRNSKFQLSIQKRLKLSVAKRIITPIPTAVVDEVVMEGDGSDVLSLDFIMYDSGVMHTKYTKSYETAGGSTPISKRRPLRPFGRNPLGIPTLQEVAYDMGGVLNVNH